MHKNANKTGGLLRQEAAGSYILDRMVQRGLEISLSEGNPGLLLGDGLVADRQRVGELPLGEAAFLPPCGDKAACFELIHGMPPFFWPEYSTKRPAKYTHGPEDGGMRRVEARWYVHQISCSS